MKINLCHCQFVLMLLYIHSFLGPLPIGDGVRMCKRACCSGTSLRDIRKFRCLQSSKAVQNQPTDGEKSLDRRKSKFE